MFVMSFEIYFVNVASMQGQVANRSSMIETM